MNGTGKPVISIFTCRSAYLGVFTAPGCKILILFIISPSPWGEQVGEKNLDCTVQEIMAVNRDLCPVDGLGGQQQDFACMV